MDSGKLEDAELDLMLAKLDEGEGTPLLEILAREEVLGLDDDADITRRIEAWELEALLNEMQDTAPGKRLTQQVHAWTCAAFPATPCPATRLVLVANELLEDEYVDTAVTAVKEGSLLPTPIITISN